jgi:anti-sigma factor RsiW
MTAARHNSRLWVAAFLIALALFGHDLAMAGAAHAAVAPDSTDSGHHAAHADAHTGHHGVSERAPSPAQTPADSDHSNDCGISRPIVPIPHNDPNLHPAAAAFDSLVLPTLPTLIMSTWSEPSAPPGVRRALAQVWRI